MYHGALGAVDARLQIAIDRIEEVVAVELRVEAENARAEHSLEHFAAPRTDAELLGVGPGDVPEHDHRGVRQFLAYQRRYQGEVIVLDQDDRVVAIDFLEQSGHEALVDRAVMFPVLAAEQGPRVGDVAQRPQALVGETEVVAALFFLREPNAPQAIEAFTRGNVETPARVGRLAVGAPGAVRDPGPRARAQYRLERRDQSAGRVQHLDLAVRPVRVHV